MSDLQKKVPAVEGGHSQKEYRAVTLGSITPAVGLVPLDISANAKAKQRATILDALRAGPLSTLEARERLGVLHSSGRVYELRKAGYGIETKTRTEFDAEGRPHRCGVYVLLTGAAP